MNNITVDSEFKSLIPPLSEDEFARLEQSIIAEGVRDPIITWGGVIVDGHNRYAICEKHSIDCPSREREFANRDAAKIWIIENQFGRRNLNDYQKGALALELKPLYEAEAKRRQGERTDISQFFDESSYGRTDERLAELAGVSRGTIRKIEAIEAEASKGNPKAIEAREALMSGEKKSIHGAYQTVTGKKSRTEEESTAEDGRRICVFCGEPIIEQYQDKQGWCYSCGLKHATDMQRKYRDAGRTLRENVPTFTAKSLLAELHASAERLQSSWAQSIEINESMGVKLKVSKKKRLEKMAADLLATIEKYQEEENGN